MEIFDGWNILDNYFKVRRLERQALAAARAIARVREQTGKIFGVVKWFSEEKGYGYIAYSEDGIDKSIYFNVRDAPLRLPHPGDDVLFVISKTNDKEYAHAIDYFEPPFVEPTWWESPNLVIFLVGIVIIFAMLVIYPPAAGLVFLGLAMFWGLWAQQVSLGTDDIAEELRMIRKKLDE